MKLQIVNLVIYILILILSIIFFYSFNPLIIIVANIFFFVGFIYNIFFLWIISKSKPECSKIDFFSTWGRAKINENISVYFDERYTKKYRIIVNASIFFPLIFLLIILIFVCIILF